MKSRVVTLNPKSVDMTVCADTSLPSQAAFSPTSMYGCMPRDKDAGGISTQGVISRVSCMLTQAIIYRQVRQVISNEIRVGLGGAIIR